MSIWSVGYLALLATDIYLYPRNERRYRYFAAFLSALGVIGMVATRRLLTAALAEQQEFFATYFPGVGERLQQRFDCFATVTVSLVLLFFLLLPLLRQVLPSYFPQRSGRAVAWACLLLILFCAVYSFYSIHKFIDLPSYLSAFTHSALLLLHLPLSFGKERPAADAE